LRDKRNRSGVLINVYMSGMEILMQKHIIILLLTKRTSRIQLNFHVRRRSLICQIGGMEEELK
jgi:hypothetical protein